MTQGARVRFSCRRVRPVHISTEAVRNYFATLDRVLHAVEITDGSGAAMDQKSGLSGAADAVTRASAAGKTIFVIGNGGSAGISSQVAYAFTHFKGVAALCLNDPSALTGIGADHGYAQIFSRQLAAHGRSGDCLVAISSSGQSPNILNAVAAARENGLEILTLSGFKPQNPLRRSGDINLYIDSDSYGFVEVSHLALCHAIMGIAAAK
jgi:D-sedoheptulose 7-phosphate isomerase